MKKLLAISLALLTLSGLRAGAEERGINFRHDLKWTQAMEEAKKEGKLVFVDFYTQWCGPCYNMAKTVFTLPDVGYFYNNNFLSMKIDCEEPEEGAALAKKYNVHSFPTYGFIDPATGELVHRSSSRQSAERFIRTGQDALDPELRSFHIEEKYQSGDRSRKFLGDYINYYASIYKRDKVAAAFDELMASGAALTDADVWPLFDSHISGLTPYLKQVSDNYADYCARIGKEAVDAKLNKETRYGDPAEIASLCDFADKDFNLKIIEINNLLRNADYTTAATKIDALIADETVDRQELIDRMKFMVRLGYKSEELPDSWFEKCVGYLRFIAYNNRDRDDAQIHQQYADALEKLIARKAFAAKTVTDEPAVGKKAYDMRPDDLKMKPRKK